MFFLLLAVSAPVGAGVLPATTQAGAEPPVCLSGACQLCMLNASADEVMVTRFIEAHELRPSGNRWLLETHLSDVKLTLDLDSYDRVTSIDFGVPDAELVALFGTPERYSELVDQDPDIEAVRWRAKANPIYVIRDDVEIEGRTYKVVTRYDPIPKDQGGGDFLRVPGFEVRSWEAPPDSCDVWRFGAEGPPEVEQPPMVAEVEPESAESSGPTALERYNAYKANRDEDPVARQDRLQAEAAARAEDAAEAEAAWRERMGTMLDDPGDTVWTATATLRSYDDAPVGSVCVVISATAETDRETAVARADAAFAQGTVVRGRLDAKRDPFNHFAKGDQTEFCETVVR